jgi:hypothetical protein
MIFFSAVPVIWRDWLVDWMTDQRACWLVGWFVSCFGWLTDR